MLVSLALVASVSGRRWARLPAVQEVLRRSTSAMDCVAIVGRLVQTVAGLEANAVTEAGGRVAGRELSLS